MSREELKAMGVRVLGRVVIRHGTSWQVWIHWIPSIALSSRVCVADSFPTRRAAEQYARQIRKAMRGDK